MDFWIKLYWICCQPSGVTWYWKPTLDSVIGGSEISRISGIWTSSWGGFQTIIQGPYDWPGGRNVNSKGNYLEALQQGFGNEIGDAKIRSRFTKFETLS